MMMPAREFGAWFPVKMPMFPPFWGVCSRTEGMPGVPQITNGLAFMVCGNDLNWRPFVQGMSEGPVATARRHLTLRGLSAEALS